jgi:uncharacterized protein HemY
MTGVKNNGRNIALGYHKMLINFKAHYKYTNILFVVVIVVVDVVIVLLLLLLLIELLPTNNSNNKSCS